MTPLKNKPEMKVVGIFGCFLPKSKIQTQIDISSYQGVSMDSPDKEFKHFGFSFLGNIFYSFEKFEKF
jgi:hypothetical protein